MGTRLATPSAADVRLATRAGPRRARSGQSPALSVEGVEKRWTAGGPAVLAGVDLCVEAGGAVAVTGPNGAGKTTLLRITAGLIDPDAGRVGVFGVDPSRDRSAFQRQVGFVGAGSSGLYGRLRAEDHLELAVRLALMARRNRAPAIRSAVATFGLEPFCGRRVDRLSMGERQRLRLALAFLHRPSLVLLDEPTTSLDEEGIALLQAALDELKERGGAAVVCMPTGWEGSLALDGSYLLRAGTLTSR